MLDIKSFGAVGDGIADDSNSFTLAENSQEQEIYISVGTYLITNINLSKRYYGPGQIVLNGIKLARKFSNVTELPTRGSSPSDYFGGEQSFTESEQFHIDSSVNRKSIDAPYYDYPLIQHFNRSTFESGESGYDAAISRPTVPGTNYVFVTDITPFKVGDEVIIGAYLPDGELNVLTGVYPTGQMDLLYPIQHQHGSYTENTIASVALSKRTHTSIYQTEMDVLGDRTGGDFIAHSTRIACGATHNPGRNHAFDRTTIGFVGGDAVAYEDGIYIAGTEYMYYDTATPGGVQKSGDIFVVDQVRSFTREKDTGNYGCVWLGTLYKSEGSKYANSTHVISGKWKRGLDTSLADFGQDNAAVAFGKGHKVYWNCQSNPDLDGFKFWSDQLGGISMKGDNDGVSDFWEINVNGNPAIRARNSGVAVSGSITASTAIMAADSLSAIGSGSQISVPVGGSIRLSGLNGGTYLTFDGSKVYLVKNGAAVASW